jgi:hypothetical protein
VKAYLDSGVFIDYLIGRGHAGPFLRSAGRRGRTPAQLGADAEACLMKLAGSHVSLTSSLTCYEVEEAMYGELKRSATGVTHGGKYIIPAARAVMTQTLMTIDGFGIQVVDLTSQVVIAQCNNFDLQMRGVRAADALHVTTALLNSADLLISADDDVLALDSLYQTAAGATLRCLDTDAALVLL